MVEEVSSPQIRVLVALTLFGSFRGESNLFPCLSQLLEATYTPWLVASSYIFKVYDALSSYSNLSQFLSFYLACFGHHLCLFLFVFLFLCLSLLPLSLLLPLFLLPLPLSLLPLSLLFSLDHVHVPYSL